MQPDILPYQRPQPIHDKPQWWWAVRVLPISGGALLAVAAIGAMILPQRPSGPWYVIAWAAIAGALFCILGLAMSIAALIGRHLSTRRGVIGCVLAVGLPLAVALVFVLRMLTHPLG